MIIRRRRLGRIWWGTSRVTVLPKGTSSLPSLFPPSLLLSPTPSNSTHHLQLQLHSAGVLRGLALGPLGYDVELLKKSMAGVGTDEMCLTELILNRPQDELRLLIAAYKQRYGKDLVDAVKSELSGKLERRAYPPPFQVSSC